MNVTETFRGFSAQRSLPLDVERTETVRSGPSGSADHTGLHAQGRVAVPPTLPLDVERTGCTPSHCHSTSNVPRRCAQGRVEVPSTWNCTLRPEWQCRPHCHSTSSVPRRYAQGRVEVPSTWNGASRAEWQCRPHCHSIVNERLHALTLPLDVERTETVRSGPSGSAAESEGGAPVGDDCGPRDMLGRAVAQARGSADYSGAGRVGHRRDQPPATCRALLLRRPRKDAAGDAGRRPLPRHAALLGVCRPPGCRERRESDERREAPERAKRAWLKCEESPAGRQREVREGPAPDRSHTGCGPGLPDGRGDANAAQKSMSTLLKNKFHSLSSGHIA